MTDPSIPVVPGDMPKPQHVPGPPLWQAPAKPKRGMRSWKVWVALALAGALVGVGVIVGFKVSSTDDPPSTPAATVPPTATHYANPDATKACDLVRAADDASDYSSATLAGAIDPAERSGSFDLAFAANMATDRAELAELAQDATQKFEFDLATMNAVTEMLTQCAKLGY